MNNDFIKLNLNRSFADISDSNTWFMGNNTIAIPMGKNESDEIVSIVLGSKEGQVGNLLIEGGMGSGRASLINGIILNTLVNYDCNKVTIDYLAYSGVDELEFEEPYCCISVNNRFSDFVNKVKLEAEARKLLIERSGCSDFDEYIQKKGDGLPLILAIIDYSEKVFSRYRIGEVFKDLLKMANRVGIHFILASSNLCMMDIDAIIEEFEVLLVFDHYKRGHCFLQNLKNDDADKITFEVAPVDGNLMRSTLEKLVYIRNQKMTSVEE